MSEVFRFSGGHPVEVPAQSGQSSSSWKFSVRPGGWIVAESPAGVRKRLMVFQMEHQVSAILSGRLWNGEVRRKGVETRVGDMSTESDLVAQFPGKVRKILVAPGSSVQEGDALLLVEAMKMEFTIKGPYEGKVIRVLVKEGQQLQPGDRLLDVERSSHGK